MTSKSSTGSHRPGGRALQRPTLVSTASGHSSRSFYLALSGPRSLASCVRLALVLGGARRRWSWAADHMVRRDPRVRNVAATSNEQRMNEKERREVDELMSQLDDETLRESTNCDRAIHARSAATASQPITTARRPDPVRVHGGLEHSCKAASFSARVCTRVCSHPRKLHCYREGVGMASWAQTRSLHTSVSRFGATGSCWRISGTTAPKRLNSG